MNQDTQDLFSMLGLDKLEKSKQEKVKELLKKIIDKWRAGENSEAYVVLNGMLAQLKLDTLDEEARAEIKDKFMQMISREAGYSVKDFLWDTGGTFNNANISDIKEMTITGADIVGKDSNLQGDLYSRVKNKDNLYRQKPKKRDFDEDEEDVIDKLKKLKQLFLNRNAKDITIDDIKKILTTESEEQIFSAKQYLNEAIKMANTVGNDKAMNYFFSESSPITSTFSHSAWSGFKYIRVNKTGLVVHSNTFLCQAGTILTSKKQAELEGMGVKIYFSEGLLNEAYQANDDLLDGITYNELLDTVYSNLENPNEKAVMKQFDELVNIKVKDARQEMKRALKQILKDVNEETLYEAIKFKKGTQVYIKPIKLYGEIEEILKDGKYLVKYETGGSGRFQGMDLRQLYGKK